MLSIRTLIEIAKAVDGARPLLGRIMLQDGKAIATDSYRLAVIDLSDDAAEALGDQRKHLTDLNDKDLERDSWLTIVERAGVVPADMQSYPNFDHLLNGSGYVTGSIAWDGDGGWAHGRRRRDFEIAISQWSYFNGDKRKPVGLIKLMVGEGGKLSYQLGMKVEDKKRMPSWAAFETLVRDAQAVLGGDLGSTLEVEPGEDWVTIGVYAIDFFRSMGFGMREIGVKAEGEMAHNALRFGYENGTGLLMPIRM